MLLKITARGLPFAIISFLTLHQCFASSTTDDLREPTTNLHQKIYPLSTTDHKIFTQNFLTAYFAEAQSTNMMCLDVGEEVATEDTVVSPFINDPSFLSASKPKVKIDGTPYFVASIAFDSVPEDNSQGGNPPTWRYALGDIIQSWEDWTFNLIVDSHPNPTIDVMVPFCVDLRLKNAAAQGDNIGWMIKIFTEPLASADTYQTVENHSRNLMELFVRFGLFRETKYLTETPTDGTAQPQATSSTTTS